MSAYMLKPNEVMIGNWVSRSGFPQKLTLADFYDWHVLSDPQYEGIPLSPEILEKYGFQRDGRLSHWIYYRHRSGEWGSQRTFTISSNSDSTNFYFESAKGTRMCAVFHYTHQLQNLYFALTGEELKINLIDHA